MDLGLMEILILGFLFVFFVAVIGGVILMVTKGGNRNRFPENDGGEPYPQWTLRADCKSILKTAGLPLTFRPYTSRHTMATLLIAGGTNVKAVSERLRHAKVTITLQEYTHVSRGMQSYVSEEIERLLEGKNDWFYTVGIILA